MLYLDHVCINRVIEYICTVYDHTGAILLTKLRKGSAGIAAISVVVGNAFRKGPWMLKGYERFASCTFSAEVMQNFGGGRVVAISPHPESTPLI